jgi:sodium/potassium-transporting ATPase subunit alpha
LLDVLLIAGFFSLLLWAGAILCFVGYSIERADDNLYLGIVLVTVVMVTGIFSYLQNSKSENLMASFASMLPPKVKLLREVRPSEERRTGGAA